MPAAPTTARDVGAILRDGVALTLDDLKQLGIHPQDVDEKWMDEMVKRLFHEIRKQLSQLEVAKAAGDTAENATRRKANAATLSALERTLERLARLEQRRVFNRETKVIGSDDDARAALERRLDQRLAAMRALVAPEEPKQ